MRFRFPEWLWAVSRALHQRGLPKLARAVKIVNYVLHKALLPAEAIVGDNLVLEHYALGVVIHPQVTIGNDCRIYHHVTLASESGIGSPFRVVLGDGVTIGAHSVIVARPNCSLTIGDGAIVGAGSVVTRDIPGGEVWAGNPAQKLRNRGEETVVEASFKG